MSIVNTMISAACYKYIYNSRQQEKFQDKELHKLVKYVKNHSPYLQKLYGNVGDDFKITDLPITNKKMIMENYDVWATDPEIKLEDVKKFVKDTNNVGCRYLGKYLIGSTSGSTGYPLHTMINQKIINASTCTALLSKALSRKPVALVYPKDVFLIENGAILYNMKRFPHIMKKSFPLVDALQSPDRIAAELNRIQPKTVYAYTSVIESIAEQAERGNLKANIEEVVCCSEMLTDKARNYISKQLNCVVRSIYGCTESGNIAIDGPCGHMHLINPYIIIEYMDENNNPVKPGEQSYKILVTNLSNDVLPIIRYEVMDHLTLHPEPCGCGDRSQWIEMEGRSGLELLEFSNGIKVAPILVYCVVELMDTLRKFQIILHSNDVMEFRAVFMPDVDEAAVYEEAKERVMTYLKECGIDSATMYLADEKPAVDPVTQKFKSVYQVRD